MSEFTIAELDYANPGLCELAAAHLILREIYPNKQRDEGPNDLDVMAHFQNNRRPDVVKYGLINGDELVGAVYACHDFHDKIMARNTGVEKWTAIYDIAVAAQHRRQGHARRLLGHVATEAIEKGNGVISLVAAKGMRPIFAGIGFRGRRGDNFMWAAASALVQR